MIGLNPAGRLTYYRKQDAQHPDLIWFDEFSGQALQEVTRSGASILAGHFSRSLCPSNWCFRERQMAFRVRMSSSVPHRASCFMC